MKNLLTYSIVILLTGISACANDESNSEPATALNNSNADKLSKMAYQQFIALHSHDLLVRNTAVSQPAFASPCTNNGGYGFTKTGASNSFNEGDTVTETYSNCTYSLGNITVSGTVISKLTEKTTSKLNMNVQHRNLSVTSDGQLYRFNGSFSTSLGTNSTSTQMINEYRGYTLIFRGRSTNITAGRSTVNLNIVAKTYDIDQSIVFSGSDFSSRLRADTSGGANGKTTASNENIYPFNGSLRLRAIGGDGVITLTSIDNDSNDATYQRSVRSNGRTTRQRGLLWTDLLN